MISLIMYVHVYFSQFLEFRMIHISRSTSEVDVFEYSISDVILPIPYLIGRQEINIWIVFVFRCH